MDLGGDKFVSPLGIPRELNPFMGWRGIRFCLEQPEIFETQLRAILRASTEGKLSIMFPLVSSLDELKEAKRFVAAAKRGLVKERKSFNENVEIGVMIETPSAAMIADILAEEVDFFSIGTNDLIQYSIAIDRINERVAYLYRPAHPGVLRLIKRVVDAGHSKGIRVDMCGEMAGEAQFATVLLGLGVDGFSMSPVAIPTIKSIIRSVTLSKAKEMALDILDLSTADEVERVLGGRGVVTG
jgi:phosphotransferase system enzyme I (PtsI)